MSSVRVGQRIPLRPSAERSPSPDMGGKAIIINTTPPKISKEEIMVKRNREESIIRIKEENKRLKDQMKNFLHKSKDVDLDDNLSFKNDQIVKKEIKPISSHKSSISVNDRPTEKHSYKQSPNFPVVSQFQKGSPNHSQISPQEIKDLMNSMMKTKQDTLNKKIEYLELNLRQAEQTQRSLQLKIAEYSNRLRSSSKNDNRYNTTPVATNSPFDQIKQDQGGFSSSPNRYYTPSKNQQRSKSLIHQLQFQLSAAQSTIRKLETILQTQQNSIQSLRFETEKKDTTIFDLKKQNQTLAKQLKSAYKQNHSKLELESSIKKQNMILEDIQKRLFLKEEQFNTLKEITDRQISRLKLEIKNQMKQSIKSNKSEEEKRKREEERKRQMETHRLQDTENRLEQSYEIIKILEKQLQLAKKGKFHGESEVRQGKQTIVDQENRIDELVSENERLKEMMNKMREQVEQINNVNKKFNEQRAEIQSLASQLTQTIKSLEETKSDHKSETFEILGEVKQIKSLAESVHIPDNTLAEQRFVFEKQTLVLKHKQQILELQRNVCSLQAQKQLMGSDHRQLCNENHHLKQQIKSLQLSIENYVKPVQREIAHIEQIETIMLKQQITGNQKMAANAKIISGVTFKLTKICEEVNRSSIQISREEANDRN